METERDRERERNSFEGKIKNSLLDILSFRHLLNNPKEEFGYVSLEFSERVRTGSQWGWLGAEVVSGAVSGGKVFRGHVTGGDQ